jgi:hypothetical protein
MSHARNVLQTISPPTSHHLAKIFFANPTPKLFPAFLSRARTHCETLQHAQFNLNGILVDLTFTGALAAVFALLLARPKMPEKSVAKATIGRNVKNLWISIHVDMTTNQNCNLQY